jgi:hypothetical protein
MVGARIALGAALFAEMMAKGYLSEDECFNDQKQPSRLNRTAWDELKKGNKLDERVRRLLSSDEFAKRAWRTSISAHVG